MQFLISQCPQTPIYQNFLSAETPTHAAATETRLLSSWHDNYLPMISKASSILRQEARICHGSSPSSAHIANMHKRHGDRFTKLQFLLFRERLPPLAIHQLVFE